MSCVCLCFVLLGTLFQPTFQAAGHRTNPLLLEYIMIEYYYGNGRSNKVSGQEDQASAKQALLMPTSADSKRKHAADSSLATQQRRRTGEDSHRLSLVSV